MSTDYALFIIIVPNDFDLVNSRDNIEKTVDLTKQESSTSSLNTISALVVSTTTMTQNAVPSVNNTGIREKSEPPLNSINQSALCVLLKNYTERTDLDTTWMMSDDKKTFQITFYVEFGLVSDGILHDLTKMNIGIRSGTKVFVLPTTVVLKGHINDKVDQPSSRSDSIIINNNNNNNNVLNDELSLTDKVRKRVHESNFKKSVRARLMVHQVVASIRASSAITFDFVLLICLASMLAALGLLENSSVIIVASMLVSPLMNPILGIVFGLSIRDHSLWKRGLRNETIGLIICITCGFVIGLFTTIWETRWGSSSSFPTSEMRSRGDVKRLWVGILIALPSGTGVALSVLGGNTGSLVGVAISASLLPPAVNCGLLFAYGFLRRILSTHFDLTSSFLCTNTTNNSYQPLYTCNIPSEAAILACCSLLLTIVNIICIIIMALIILRIKEVVPLHQPNKDISNFFHYDVKVARDYNKTIQANEWTLTNLNTMNLQKYHLAQSIVNRWKTFKSPSKTVDVESNDCKNDSLTSQDNESTRKLFRLKTFANEYDLDIFNRNDYDLTNCESEEKVRLLVCDLIDMCQEIPSVFVDLYRLQPSSTTDNEHLTFYEEIIEVLPPKWFQLFKYERQLRHIKAWPSTFNRSYSMRSYQLKMHENSLTESKNPKKTTRTSVIRQTSVPETNRSSNIDTPIQGTRFRITKPTILTSTVNLFGNESELI